MNETKVRRRTTNDAQVDTDTKLAANVFTAWRKLWFEIDMARRAGITVETAFDDSNVPRISRKYPADREEGGVMR